MPLFIRVFPRISALLLALLAWCSLPSWAQSVELFSPQGEVKAVRQVTARFAKAMVPFGELREVDLFAVDCVEKGRGRWADMKNWVYDFDRDLPAGVRCTFTVKPGVTTLDGTAVPAGERFEFSTGGPAIVRSLPWEGSNIDENQMFIVGLDSPVAAESIPLHAYCSADGVNEKIGVRLVTGDERKTILDNRKSFAASYLRFILLDANAGRTRGSFLFRLPLTGSDEEKFLRLRDAPDSPLVTLACTRTLPPNKEVKLVWGKGISSSSGVPTSADQALAYRVRPTFRAAFSCERVNKDAQCIPILPLRLAFTAPVTARDAARIHLVDSAGKIYPAHVTRDDDAISAVTFGPGLPERESFRIELPPGFKDDAGRALANAASFPLKVRTDENPPLAKFPADFGILERVLPDRAPPLLPVTLRNVEATLKASLGTTGRPTLAADQAATRMVPAKVARVRGGDEKRILEWLQRFQEAQRVDAEYNEKTERWVVKRNGHAVSMFRASDSLQTLEVPKPNGEKAFEVVGIPLPDAGFYVVELASPKLGAALNGDARPYYARTTVLVTNLGVHLKLGRESSLVWVTRLADGKPAKNASVDVRNCDGEIFWRGKSDASGIARINAELPDREELPSCPGGERDFFVTARLGDDMSFAFSSWGEGISPWRFNVPTGNWNGPYVAHAVLDRTLFRAGETVSMKVFLRQLIGEGFSLVPRDALQDTLTITHQGSEREYEVPVHWAKLGDRADHGEATFAIPGDAALGTYIIAMHDSLGSRHSRSDERPLCRFRVEAFRVPLMRARLQPVGSPFTNPSDVQIDLQVSYLSGGGAGGLPVKLRTQVEPRSVAFADFDGYSFAAGDVTEGRTEEGESYARFADYAFVDPDYSDGDEDAQPSVRGRRTTDLNLSLDAAGGARATVKNVGHDPQARDLIAELEYRDPNGETLTSSARVTLWPSGIILGLKPDSWVASKDRLKYTVAAVDLNGKPVAGVQVQTDVFKRETYSHRRRLIGGFYAYEHGSETKWLTDLCAGTTDDHGLLICEVASPAAGDLILRARAADSGGNAAVTRADAWVATGEDWWFAASDNDRIDLLPEKKRYEPGDTARFQLRMPFKEATVLVTVEREGVLDAFVRTIKRGDPVLEVPIKGSYAPNVYISALVVRGRVGGVEPTALIDLAKPSFKMGLAEIRVGWSAHELSVRVSPAQAAYKVRDHVSVAIAARQADGSAPPAGSEVALAAVDEGLLELLPNDTWKLLDAMMTRRGEEVETSTAQTQVIGKRHFGKKAIPAGGGGGRASARELFDTLLLWKARVPLDAAGDARVEIPLNDSLTSFRIVAIASSGAGLFGTGDASIRSTQDLMLLSGLPPVVRESDRFHATFTLRNATEQPMPVRLTAVVAASGKAPGSLEPRQLDLAPGESREVGWEMTVPVGVTRLEWQLQAVQRADDRRPEATGLAHDAIKVTQSVLPAVPQRTYQATMLQLTEPLAISVQLPSDAIPGRGGIGVRMQAKLAGDLAGVDEYLSRYPYTCFEQRASVAVGLQSRVAWDALMGALPEYIDRDGLVKYWPLLRDGSDTLTAYVLSVADEAGWEIPDDSRRRMETALVGFIEGRVSRYSDLQTADLSIRKMAALEALSRRRAAVNPKWLDSIAIEPNLWPTSAVIDWYLVLKRSSGLPQRADHMKAAEQILRSRLNFQGTTMEFSTEKSDALWWLMVSADSNANRLLLALIDEPAWKEDMPRLVRGSLGRMQRGHWNTTTANAWGVLAVAKFSAAFETESVTGTTNATLPPAHFAHAWTTADDAKPFDGVLAWPAQRADLSLAHDGGGSPWITVQSIAAIPLKDALSSGYKISREVIPLQQQSKGKWSRGDVARVHLEVEAQSDMTWVVVDDPIPAGSTALGRGLGGDSALLAQGADKRGTVWPAYEERTFTTYRAYFRYVPKGKFVLEYTVRLNNPGLFHLPTTRVEAMYAPEMFGELPNADWRVLP